MAAHRRARPSWPRASSTWRPTSACATPRPTRAGTATPRAPELLPRVRVRHPRAAPRRAASTRAGSRAPAATPPPTILALLAAVRGPARRPRRARSSRSRSARARPATAGRRVPPPRAQRLVALLPAGRPPPHRGDAAGAGARPDGARSTSPPPPSTWCAACSALCHVFLRDRDWTSGRSWRVYRAGPTAASRSCASSRRGAASTGYRSRGSWPARTTATSASPLTPSRNRLVVARAIDNLMKGAAGQAVQALNLMFGCRRDHRARLPRAAPGVGSLTCAGSCW